MNSHKRAIICAGIGILGNTIAEATSANHKTNIICSFADYDAPAEPHMYIEEPIDGCRVITAGNSPAKSFRRNDNTARGYKARKEYWR